MLLQMAFRTEKFSGVSRNAQARSLKPHTALLDPVVNRTRRLLFLLALLPLILPANDGIIENVKYFSILDFKKFPFLLQIFCTGKTLPKVKVIRAIDTWKKRQHRKEIARRFWPSDRNVADHFGWMSSLFGMPHLDRLRYFGFIYDEELIFFWNVILSLVAWEK